MSHLHGECGGKLKQKRKEHNFKLLVYVCFFINVINTVIFLWKMFVCDPSYDQTALQMTLILFDTHDKYYSLHLIKLCDIYSFKY